MKFTLATFIILFSMKTMALSRCDVRPGISLGIPVVEFASGNEVYSKFPMNESTPAAIAEEMLSLQDMELCSEKIQSEKCVLRFEKNMSKNVLTFYRGKDKWKSWETKEKRDAQEFVLRLKRAGFCS
ncbi:MAG: hypothetical protein AB7I27_16315 [Bacteriovoracaceae bacterium]